MEVYAKQDKHWLVQYQDSGEESELIDLSQWRSYSKTGYRGVKARSGGFEAQIYVRGEGLICLGTYHTAEQAAKMYARAYLKLNGAAPVKKPKHWLLQEIENDEGADPIDLSHWRSDRNKSGYMGVKEVNSGSFRAVITVPGDVTARPLQLGMFDTAEDAAEMYARARLKLRQSEKAVRFSKKGVKHIDLSGSEEEEDSDDADDSAVSVEYETPGAGPSDGSRGSPLHQASDSPYTHGLMSIDPDSDEERHVPQSSRAAERKGQKRALGNALVNDDLDIALSTDHASAVKRRRVENQCADMEDPLDFASDIKAGSLDVGEDSLDVIGPPPPLAWPCQFDCGFCDESSEATKAHEATCPLKPTPLKCSDSHTLISQPEVVDGRS